MGTEGKQLKNIDIFVNGTRMALELLRPAGTAGQRPFCPVTPKACHRHDAGASLPPGAGAALVFWWNRRTGKE